MTKTTHVLEQAMRLPRKSRLRIANELVDSLTVEEVDAVWKKEIRRRLRNLESTKWVRGDEVLKALKKKYQK